MSEPLIKAPLGGAVAPSRHLEALLDELARYGRAHLSHMRSGWYCRVEMYASPEGADFTVASDFGGKTPRDAATQCLERVLGAVTTVEPKPICQCCRSHVATHGAYCYACSAAIEQEQRQ